MLPAVIIFFGWPGQWRRVHNWTEPNWRGLVFDELPNGQAVMHYSRHSLTVLARYSEGPLCRYAPHC